MKRVLALIFGATMLLGTVAVTGAVADPGPNDSNNKGLCTAYFNGSDTGRANKRGAPPFVALVEAAGDDGVEAFCDGMVGGNPNYDEPGEPNNNRGGNKPTS